MSSFKSGSCFVDLPPWVKRLPLRFNFRFGWGGAAGAADLRNWWRTTDRLTGSEEAIGAKRLEKLPIEREGGRKEVWRWKPWDLLGIQQDRC